MDPRGVSYWDKPADAAWLRDWRGWAPRLARDAARAVPSICLAVAAGLGACAAAGALIAITSAAMAA